MAYLDASGEALAGLLRPGNAGSGTAADHVAVLDDALAQLPVNPTQVEVITRADSAGWSHGFVEGCRERHVRFVIGHRLDIDVAKLLVELPEQAWQPAISADGAEWRDNAEVVEITGLVDLAGWPTGCRMIARREDPHPGAQLTFTDIDGHRFQLFVTDLTDPDIAYLEALYRGRGRAERQICDTKATGLTNLPSHSFAINHTGCNSPLTAHDLLNWTRLLVLNGDLAVAEPKRLRYSLLHTAGQLITTGRRRYCRLATSWPWTTELIDAFNGSTPCHYRSEPTPRGPTGTRTPPPPPRRTARPTTDHSDLAPRHRPSTSNRHPQHNDTPTQHRPQPLPNSLG